MLSSGENSSQTERLVREEKLAQGRHQSRPSIGIAFRVNVSFCIPREQEYCSSEGLIAALGVFHCNRQTEQSGPSRLETEQ